MFAPLLVLLLVVPILELWLIVRVANVIDIGPTLLLLIGISIFGAWLLKREGMAAWRRLQVALGEGRMPTKEVTDGALILFGGALLLTPGFFTDAVGLMCVFPLTRVTMKGAFRRLIGFLTVKRFGPAGYAGTRIYQGRVTRSQRRAGSTQEQPEGAPDPLPPSSHEGHPPTDDDPPEGRPSTG